MELGSDALGLAGEIQRKKELLAPVSTAGFDSTLHGGVAARRLSPDAVATQRSRDNAKRRYATKERP